MQSSLRAPYTIQRTNACEDFLSDKLAAAGSVFRGDFRASSRNQRRPIVAVYFPKHGKNGADFFGIESNPKTRAMYEKYDIESLCFADFKKQTVDKN